MFYSSNATEVHEMKITAHLKNKFIFSSMHVVAQPLCPESQAPNLLLYLLTVALDSLASKFKILSNISET